MPLQDNTEDFRSDMRRFHHVHCTPFEDLRKERARVQRMFYVVAVLLAALATAGYWIATH
jgi:hypothetical protein